MHMNRAALINAIMGRLDGKVSLQWAHPAPGTPTRSAVIDNLLPEDVTRAIYEAFPPNAEGFIVRDSFREKKRQAYDLSGLPALIADITYALQSKQVVDRIGELTGIPDLDGDPTLYAGGVSMMLPGDFLNPHIDNSHEATRRKYRRINSLFYVTPDWKTENGGHLELWNDAVTRPHVIESRFNRLVLMETNSRSWHSVSPVVAKAGARCCVSNYYFSEASPSGADYYHVTSFHGRPEQPFRRAWSTLDNNARLLARHMGMRRKADDGFVKGREVAGAE